MKKSLCALILLTGCTALASHRSDIAPTPPPAGTVRVIIGGDARDDVQRVVPWAFAEARRRGATAFIFLGDMELTPELDWVFKRKLRDLEPVNFYPLLGNHEVKELGIVSPGFASLRQERVDRFQSMFLDTPQTPVSSDSKEQVYYSADLASGLRYIALDNVSQRGFGKRQIQWLQRKLDEVTPGTVVIVGMHQPLANNGCTDHSMAKDGPQAIADSEQVLRILAAHHVNALFASHTHELDCFKQKPAVADIVAPSGVQSYVTGGMGAPLTRMGPDRSFHHVLQVDVTNSNIAVSVVRFPGKRHVMAEDDEEREEGDEEKVRGPSCTCPPS